MSKKSKKIFLVTRVETSSEYIFVEARTKKEAIESADEIDAELWSQNQDYDGELSAERAEPEDLLGRIINRRDGSYYNYK
jgi:hypothetical protein